MLCCAVKCVLSVHAHHFENWVLNLDGHAERATVRRKFDCGSIQRDGFSHMILLGKSISTLAIFNVHGLWHYLLF